MGAAPLAVTATALAQFPRGGANPVKKGDISQARSRWCWVGPVGYCLRPRTAEDEPSPWGPDDPDMVLDSNRTWFYLSRFDLEEDEVEFPLRDSDVDFVLANCCCFYCGTPFNEPLRECECGRVNKDEDYGADIRAIQPTRINEGLTDRVVSSVQAKKKAAHRSRLLRQSQGRHVTQAELKLLFQAQAGLCYYCGGTIVERGPGKFHHDHFVSLSDGGRRDLENAVLACPPCNLHKNSLDGLRYLERRDRRQPADPDGLTRMHKAFHAWRKSQGFQTFKQLAAAPRR